MVNFYRRSLPHAASAQASLNAYLCDSRKNDKREIEWTQEAEEAFDKVKTDLANAALLAYPSPNAEIQIVTDGFRHWCITGTTFRWWCMGSLRIFFEKILSDATEIQRLRPRTNSCL